MSSKIIEIIVSPKGETTVQTKGFAGSSCRDATQALEEALGVIQSDKATAEMYAVATTDQQIRQNNG